MRLVRRRQKDVVCRLWCAVVCVRPVKRAPKSRQKAELPRRILNYGFPLPLRQKEGILKGALKIRMVFIGIH